jgi:cytochrome c
MIKRILVFSMIVTSFYACGDESNKGTTATDKPAVEDITKNPDYQKGLALIGKSDCLTCHKIEEASTGPAYRDVANKYTNDDKTITMLSEKIIKGGTGNWGQVPMVAHPALLPDDAKQIVKFILLLKNK